VINLIQVPATLMLLSAGMDHNNAGSTSEKLSLGGQVLQALREPVVWAPLAALVLVICDIPFPAVAENSLMLLGRATGGVELSSHQASCCFHVVWLRISS
jgi:malonate transporter and related proteins